MRDRRRRGGRVDIGSGRLHQPIDDGRVRGDEGARHAGGLAERAHADEALAAQTKVRQGAAAVRTEHAEAVRVVDDDPGIEALGQRQQFGQRRQVAVHAEHRVGHDQLDRRGATRELVRQHVHAAMRVTLQRRLGEQGAVDQRGVVELVGEERCARVTERRQQRDVGHVASAEAERSGARNAGFEEVSQILFKRRVCARMAADQMRGAAANAPALRAFGERCSQLGMAGEAEIVVAAKGQHRARHVVVTRHRQVRRTRRLDDPTAPPQRLRIALTQLLVQVLNQHGGRCGCGCWKS